MNHPKFFFCFTHKICFSGDISPNLFVQAQKILWKRFASGKQMHDLMLKLQLILSHIFLLVCALEYWDELMGINWETNIYRCFSTVNIWNNWLFHAVLMKASDFVCVIYFFWMGNGKKWGWEGSFESEWGHFSFFIEIFRPKSSNFFRGHNFWSFSPYFLKFSYFSRFRLLYFPSVGLPGDRILF